MRKYDIRSKKYTLPATTYKVVDVTDIEKFNSRRNAEQQSKSKKQGRKRKRGKADGTENDDDGDDGEAKAMDQGASDVDDDDGSNDTNNEKTTKKNDVGKKRTRMMARRSDLETTEPVVVFSPMTNARGHTGYLTFATRPIQFITT
eukprot:TRINITY_DN60228_c0_g1_i1.p1 TRINITY_DN60228_c0_g1~~TRINITY_DN60228_c0_g1_i1.p1  ORF type:complete len:146 (+),score=78.51 TRINITY_DN60228_c0_g1_i1:424-861(+)